MTSGEEPVAPAGNGTASEQQPSPETNGSGPAHQESLGSVLAHARESRGLSVDDVSAITRVRSTLVADIEQDDFSHCAAPVYARGHIRSIARAVGVDADPLIAEYDREHGTTPPPTIVPLPAPSRFLAPETRRRSVHWMPIALVVAVLVVIGALVLLLLPGKGKDDSSAPPVTSSSAGKAAAAPASAAPRRSTAPPATAYHGVSLRVAIIGTASWLQVSDGNQQVLVSQVLQPGTVRTFTSTGQLRLTTGNAGAVALSCNGRALGAAGTVGAVVNITLSQGAGGACTRA